MTHNKTAYLIDDQLYTVVCANGWRRNGLTLEAARAMRNEITRQWAEVGQRANAVIYYRDGSKVE